MQWDAINEQWLELKGAVKERWGELTDDDIKIISGKRDRLVAKLRERYGYVDDRAQEEADRFSREFAHPVPPREALA